jgi:hypothetical protein
MNLIQAGVGISYFVTERSAVYAGLNAQHISNARLNASQDNFALNTPIGAVLGDVVVFLEPAATKDPRSGEDAAGFLARDRSYEKAQRLHRQRRGQTLALQKALHPQAGLRKMYLFGGSAPDQMTPSPRWHGAVDGSNEMYQ